MPRTYTIALALCATVLILGFVALFAYDASTTDSVADGVRVANVDVGGLSRHAAEQRVSAHLVSTLNRPLTIPAGGRAFHLTAGEAHVRTDVRAIVDAAIKAGRDGGMFARAWRGLTGGEHKVTITPKVTYSATAVDRLVARVQGALDRPAVDAKVAFAPGNVTIHRGHAGRTVDARRLRADVLAKLTSPVGDRTVAVPIRTERPTVSNAKLAGRYPTVIAINRSAFRLTLFKKLKAVKSYPIAVGQVGLETPAGLYKITNKAVDPAWTVPNSPWAGSLAGQVIPGGAANNPLKARWLGVYDGVGVHGTSDRASIGSNASHGCIRMLVEDVVALYDRVPVGTPIYIG